MFQHLCLCCCGKKTFRQKHVCLFFHKEYVTTFTSFYIVRMCHLCYFIVYVNMLWNVIYYVIKIQCSLNNIDSNTGQCVVVSKSVSRVWFIVWQWKEHTWRWGNTEADTGGKCSITHVWKPCPIFSVWTSSTLALLCSGNLDFRYMIYRHHRFLHCGVFEKVEVILVVLTSHLVVCLLLL